MIDPEERIIDAFLQVGMGITYIIIFIFIWTPVLWVLSKWWGLMF